MTARSEEIQPTLKQREITRRPEELGPHTHRILKSLADLLPRYQVLQAREQEVSGNETQRRWSLPEVRDMHIVYESSTKENGDTTITIHFLRKQEDQSMESLHDPNFQPQFNSGEWSYVLHVVEGVLTHVSMKDGARESDMKSIDIGGEKRDLFQILMILQGNIEIDLNMRIRLALRYPTKSQRESVFSQEIMLSLMEYYVHRIQDRLDEHMYPHDQSVDLTTYPHEQLVPSLWPAVYVEAKQTETVPRGEGAIDLRFTQELYAWDIPNWIYDSALEKQLGKLAVKDLKLQVMRLQGRESFLNEAERSFKNGTATEKITYQEWVEQVLEYVRAYSSIHPLHQNKNLEDMGVPGAKFASVVLHLQRQLDTETGQMWQEPLVSLHYQSHTISDQGKPFQANTRVESQHLSTITKPKMRLRLLFLLNELYNVVDQTLPNTADSADTKAP